MTILGAGGVRLDLFAIQYKLGFGNFSSRDLFQNISILFGLGVNDWSSIFESFLVSPEYKIKITNSISMPVGLKIVLAINPPDNNIENWNFIGIHTGLQFN